MFERAEDVLSDWLSKVNAGDLEGVLSLYDINAVLLPTFSSEIRKDPDGIRRYFIKVSSNDEVVVNLHEESLIVQKISESLYCLGGTYSWLLVKEGNRQNFLARFTYTVDVEADSPILHHHSSLVPEN